MRRSSGLMGEDDGIDAVALLEHVAGVADLLAPGHFRDVNEAFDAGFDLDECAEVHEAGDVPVTRWPGSRRSGAVVQGSGWSCLRPREIFLVSGSILRILTWSSWPTVRTSSGLLTRLGDVADVEQAVDAAQVDECAVGHEGADGAGDGVASFMASWR
jgi:hypothetical protein